MFVLIVGGGRIGGALAATLLQRGVEVTVVDKDEVRVAELRDGLMGATVVHGDGDEPVILESAHVSAAPVVAAMTNEDEDNLVVCLLARREYGVARTYARVNNRRNEWLFGPRFGVDISLSEDALDTDTLAEAIVSGSR